MKLFSVVIPTVGRLESLKVALEAFKNQVERYKDKVELIISDNGSRDGTFEEISKEKYNWLRYRRFEEQADYIQSIQRAVALTSGKYVMLFGDDDVPYPTFITSILLLIHKHPQAGIFHFNVIIGKDYGDNILHNLKMENNTYEKPEEVQKIDEMLYRHPISMSFITTVVFSRELWNRGLLSLDNTFQGYPHLSIWFNGIQNDDCVYSPYPIAYGRMPYNRDYLDKWPSYFLIEIPKLMKSIDEEGITNHLYETWVNSKDYQSNIKFLNTLLMASVYKKKYRPLCKEINRYQVSLVRRFFTYFIIICVPSWTYGLIRQIIYKQR